MSATMILKIVLFSAVLSLYLARAQKVQFEACKGVKMDATINEVDIFPCPKLPCQFKRGTTVSGSITFTMGPSVTATNATTVVHGIIGGVEVPFQTNYTDACKTTGIKCPLKPGDKDVYKAQLEVKKSYPQVNLYVKWEMQDQNKKDIFCFEFPASVV